MMWILFIPGGLLLVLFIVGMVCNPMPPSRVPLPLRRRSRGSTPLVEPAPDAFPLHYRPYVFPGTVVERPSPPVLPWPEGNALLSRPLNHNLSTIVSKGGKPPLAEDEPDNPFALDRRLLGIPAPRFDLHWISHAGMKQGTSVADCQCRDCRKWRVRLLAEGKITEQEAHPERAFVKQEHEEATADECEVNYE